MLVLRETKNPAIMWGDAGLAHLIAERAQLKTQNRSWKTEEAVLAALSRQPGELVAGTTLHPRFTRRRVRIFWLPECVPERLR